LIDDDIGKRYKCEVIKNEENWDDKSVGTGWFDYIREKNLKVGDRLVITVESPPKNMFVSFM
jgi:hypothetical protein